MGAQTDGPDHRFSLRGEESDLFTDFLEGVIEEVPGRKSGSTMHEQGASSDSCSPIGQSSLSVMELLQVSDRAGRFFMEGEQALLVGFPNGDA
jgi:hypothetical protein